MMKANYALLSMVLTIALTLPVFGQDTRDNTPKSEMKQHDMSSMMGKPTIDATVEGLHMKVWLMTQEQHKEMMKGKMDQRMMPGGKDGAIGRMEMKGMNDTSMGMGKDMKGMKHVGMGMNTAMKDSMMAGTHHIMLEVTDAAIGKNIADASAKVLLVSPSRKNSSVDLKRMMSHFGSALTLDEKGEYQVTVSVNVGGVSKTTRFQYAVK